MKGEKLMTRGQIQALTVQMSNDFATLDEAIREQLGVEKRATAQCFREMINKIKENTLKFIDDCMDAEHLLTSYEKSANDVKKECIECFETCQKEMKSAKKRAGSNASYCSVMVKLCHIFAKFCVNLECPDVLKLIEDDDIEALKEQTK